MRPDEGLNPRSTSLGTGTPTTTPPIPFFHNIKLLLLLPNTDHIQQVEDYIRGCSISTKYWPHSTSCRLYQRLFYFYQILTTFNKLKIISEVVLFLPNTDHIQQVEDYIRGCIWQLKKVKYIYRLLHNIFYICIFLVKLYFVYLPNSWLCTMHKYICLTNDCVPCTSIFT
jgi:hypothetical protein